MTLFKQNDELNIFLEKEISLIQEKLEQYKLDIHNAEEKIARSIDSIKERKKTVKLSLTKQRSLIKDATFQPIKFFLASQSLDDNESFDKLQEKLSALFQKTQEDLDNKTEVIQVLKNRINELEKLIPIEQHEKNVVDISAVKNTIEKKLIDLLPKLSVHEDSIALLDVSDLISSEDWSLVEDKANDRLRNISAMIEIKKQQLSDLDLLSQLSDGALSFSKKVGFRQEKLLIYKKIKGLSSIKNELSQDLSNISKYLEDSIKQYFHTDLINQIYESIDPHPEFKEIQFDCKIPDSGGKPELHIKLRNPEDNSMIQPTLHFSSAQINVLSLSIFLAKALNVKNDNGKSVDCIFIDDPVQSMDSINTLGLIDLFRNLSNKFDKQLIIATHDENFHELLKKKIPTDVFLSKYLALESFGKVVEQ